MYGSLDIGPGMTAGSGSRVSGCYVHIRGRYGYRVVGYATDVVGYGRLDIGNSRFGGRYPTTAHFGLPRTSRMAKLAFLRRAR